jgi:hypothetical protein
MRPKSRPVGNTGLKVLLLILYEVALLEQQNGGGEGLSCPPLPLPMHDPVHECTLFILLLLMLAAIHLYQQAGLRIRIRIGSGFKQTSGSGSVFGIRIRIRIKEGKNYPDPSRSDTDSDPRIRANEFTGPDPAHFLIAFQDANNK